MRITTRSILLNIAFVTIAVAITTSFTLIRTHAEIVRQANAVQESRLKTFWALLNEKGKSFRIQDGKMMAGNYVVNGNYELPDKVKEIFGGTATIFMGDTRVTTNVLKPDGSRAVGTKLQGAAYDAIFKEGKSYRGEAMILDVPYFTAYDPIKNDKGETIGVLYVGVKKGDYFTEYEKSKTSLIVMTLSLAVILSLLSGFITRKSLLPLKYIAGTLTEITCSERDVTLLDKRLKYTSDDEIGEVAKEINNLLEKMHQIMTLITGVSKKIHNHAGTMADTVDHQAGFASQLSSSVVEISSTMEEFSATATQIAHHSHGVVEITAKTLQDLKDGASGMETLTVKINEISHDNETNLKEIEELGSKSKEINKIMAIINNIANQTKLIAFNAALEASSAGEAGKRFGVVAGEIRRLADSVVASTSEIEGKITQIINAVNRLVISSEKSYKGVQEGLGYSAQTMSMLNEIVGGAEGTTDAAKQISFSTQQQQLASSQVVIALRDIQEGTHHSLASIQQISTVSRDLAELSDNLKILMAKFDVGQNLGGEA